jgi:hypothetical protein
MPMFRSPFSNSRKLSVAPAALLEQPAGPARLSDAVPTKITDTARYRRINQLRRSDGSKAAWAAGGPMEGSNVVSRQIAVLEDEAASVGAKAAAAYELRVLAAQSEGSRAALADAGAIPVLVGLVGSGGAWETVHAAAALSNLAVRTENHLAIAKAGAALALVGLLNSGGAPTLLYQQGQEHAAGALWRLSATDANHADIEAAGGTQALLGLLLHGSPVGKEQAAGALVNLSCTKQSSATVRGKGGRRRSWGGGSSAGNRTCWYDSWSGRGRGACK